MKTKADYRKVLIEYFGKDWVEPWLDDPGDLVHSFVLLLHELELITEQDKINMSSEIWTVEHPDE